jgi:predicted transcriptional regulator of viral defense system
MVVSGKHMDWVATLAKEATANPLVRIGDIASKYRLSSAAVSKALSRQAGRGLLEKLSDDAYLNKLAASPTPRDIVNRLVPDSYVSLGSAMAEWGLSSQNPVAVTCVTNSRRRSIKTPSVQIIYRKIKDQLFWGYVEKKARYGSYRIAEPEKALLDWIYFSLQDGFPVQLDEIQFAKLSRSRLVSYAKKFPSTVMQALFLPMLEGEIVGLQP